MSTIKPMPISDALFELQKRLWEVSPNFSIDSITLSKGGLAAIKNEGDVSIREKWYVDGEEEVLLTTMETGLGTIIIRISPE